ncbi:hypothetical protein O6H91_23G040200 [Diphasiastrum complanatum]|uniref:Uncharacterized protein n=1 Tax=Diphasiastrum complanatum TaxID=34168 RepID=A0ACC2AA13_DIPCM|nr:hypothetical protein O6H91_23G040200 [Diphasiastrum complanatum]
MEDADKHKDLKRSEASGCGREGYGIAGKEDRAWEHGDADVLEGRASPREQCRGVMNAEAKAGKWQKVVYGGMQNGFADNYTDSSFLEAMVMNANVVKRDTWTTVRDSVVISQYLSAVAMVATVWTHSLKAPVDASFLLLLDALLLLLGFVIVLLTTDYISFASLYRSVLHIVFFVCGLYVMTPIFQTLTRSISSDSIWASTVCLLLVHLFFHDYTHSTVSFTRAKHSQGVSPSFLANVSLHASIVASVLIASRLPSWQSVFSLMLFSLEIFLLFPLVAYCIQKWSTAFHLAFSFILTVVTMGLLFPLNRMVFYLYVLVILFITFVCPIFLIKIQEYKFEINGPWDEAKLCFDID